MKKKYTLGNPLRGYFTGEFKSQNEAWKYLSQMFLMAWPSRGGRGVNMSVYEENNYKINQFIICQEGTTWRGNNLDKKKVLKLCSYTTFGQ